MARKSILVIVVSLAAISFYCAFENLSFAESQPVSQNPEDFVHQPMVTGVVPPGHNPITSVPFGFHIGRIYPKDIFTHNPDNLADPKLWGTYSYAEDVGAGWERPGMYAFIPPQELGATWQQLMDSNYGSIPVSMHILANIDVRRWAAIQPSNIPKELQKLSTYNPPASYLKLVDEEKYIQFVKDLVERYDGDGLSDMPGLKNPIKYWQIDNELPGPPPSGVPLVLDAQADTATIASWFNVSVDNYTHILEITAKAIKAQDPQAKVVLSGMADVGSQTEKLFHTYYLRVLEKLTGKDVDIFDYHFYGNATGNYRVMKDAYAMIREGLDVLGYKGMEIWITETAVYSGRPRDVEGYASSQTEKEQAVDLFRRIVFPLSFGVKKVFWFSIMDNAVSQGPDGYMGLLYNGHGDNNPGYCAKKLSYFTFKKLSETLDGGEWDTIQVIQEKDGIYVYKFITQGKPVWVIWNDTQEETPVSISGIASAEAVITEAVPKYEFGKDIVDYHAAFNSEIKPVKEGKLQVLVKDIPLFVYEKQAVNVKE